MRSEVTKEIRRARLGVRSGQGVRSGGEDGTR